MEARFRVGAPLGIDRLSVASAIPRHSCESFQTWDSQLDKMHQRMLRFILNQAPGVARACSNAWPRRRIVPSSKWRPRICIPMGKPADSPHGTEMPGIPVSEAVTVKISAKYIASGSSDFSPILNAGVGFVG